MANEINKTLKAKRLVTLGKIVKVLGHGVGKERFLVTGKNDTYDVVFDSRKNRWTCSCPNIKSVHCYHIFAASMVAGRFFDENPEIVDKKEDD